MRSSSKSVLSRPNNAINSPVVRMWELLLDDVLNSRGNLWIGWMSDQRTFFHLHRLLIVFNIELHNFIIIIIIIKCSTKQEWMVILQFSHLYCWFHRPHLNKSCIWHPDRPNIRFLVFNRNSYFIDCCPLPRKMKSKSFLVHISHRIEEKRRPRRSLHGNINHYDEFAKNLFLFRNKSEIDVSLRSVSLFFSFVDVRHRTSSTKRDISCVVGS